jgi:hypothetical protein
VSAEAAAELATKVTAATTATPAMLAPPRSQARLIDRFISYSSLSASGERQNCAPVQWLAADHGQAGQAELVLPDDRHALRP